MKFEASGSHVSGGEIHQRDYYASLISHLTILPF
jgi:hypothetical protein